MATSIRRNVWFYISRFLGAFAKLRKATISFVVSVRPHATNSLALDWFSWNLIFQDFSKICWENSSVVKIGENMVRYMNTDVHFWSYRAHFLEREMFQTKVAEKIKPHLVFSNIYIYIFFFHENLTIDAIMWKNIVQRGRPLVTIMALAHCMLEN